MSADAALEVVAGVLTDAAGRVLIAERPAGKAFAGRWEFPGGKRAPGETPRAALVRELREELGIDATALVPLMTVTHRYPGASRAVRIDCWRVSAWQGDPAPLDGQRLRWCDRSALAGADLLEADRPIVTALLLPPRFACVRRGTARAGVPGPVPRVAWLAEDGALPAEASLPGRDDMRFVVDPVVPPAAGTGVVFREPGRARVLAPGAGLEGRVVRSPADARAAAAVGADFLLLGAHLSAADRELIAAVGLPWYAAPDVAGTAVPTGVVDWDTGSR